jgi:cell division protein FtsI/penicillin-binding protein 2
LDTLIAQLTKQATSNGKFDLTRFEKLEYNIFPNPAISKVYEPGSTFKAITVAIGFDAGYFNERTKVNDPGYLAIDANPNDNIHNWCADACPFGGLETPNTMLHWSSNVGAAKFGSMIPTTVWYDYLTNHFGFGKKTGVDLGGADEEVTGTVRQPTDTSLTPAWEPIDKVEQAFGQAIAVTPLQLANAYAALANRGVLPQPHILQSYTLAGKTVTPSYPPLGTAVTQETSDRMTNLLVQQAVGGEACQALLPGYDIAAKTGTASIPGDSQNTIASTAAYGPVGADPNDQFVVLVKVDKPVDIYGSEVAAPIVRDLFYHLVNRYQIAPAAHPQQPTDGVCRYVNSSQRVPWQP